MPTPEPTGSESASTPDTTDNQKLRAHACVLCQRRKVKCDRRDPCAACTKARAECVFRAPAPPRRRPRKSPEAILLARLKKYEDLLRGFGVEIEPNDGDVVRRMEDVAIASDKPATHQSPDQVLINDKQARFRAVENGKIVMKNGKVRYLENKLWTYLSDEFMEASDILPVSSEDEDTDDRTFDSTTMDPHGGDLLLGYSPNSEDLRSQHPEPMQAFRLWQAFLDNVNPLTKVIHAPTMQQHLLEATGNPDDMSKATESLLFAIYSCAVYSMSNSECEKVTGEAKSVVLTRYQCAARQALISAGLLKTSNIMVLQAYTLFLELSMRQRYDSHSLWTLIGVATRIGQRMGLHRDGVDLKLSPFETEIRRRLWWQIILLEARAGEFSGAGQILRDMLWTTKSPLNVNDSSLHPSMVELPADQNGATEMIHCLIRYEVGRVMKSGGGQSVIDGSWQRFHSSEISVQDKEKAIQGCEELLEQRFLRYCDPSIPLHFISAIMARTTMCKLRFRAYHPRHYWARTDRVTQEEKDMLFSICVKMLEYDNIVQTSSITQRFLWQVKAQFQFDALIHVLSDLRFRKASEATNRAWQQVDEVFQHHPDMLTETKKGLHVAISRLAIRAWDNYERCSLRDQQSMYQVHSSQFREALLSRSISLKVDQPDQAVQKLEARQQGQPASAPTESMIDALGAPFDFSVSSMDTTPMDWSKWDDLLQDFELNPMGPAFI